MKRTKLRIEITADDCAICTENVIEGEFIVLSCSHVFHANCYFECMKQTCPMCRKESKITWFLNNDEKKFIRQWRDSSPLMTAALLSPLEI
ncbi:MAG: RING finger domain-containing protein [Nitrososphaeraceae archaeon]